MSESQSEAQQRMVPFAQQLARGTANGRPSDSQRFGIPDLNVKPSMVDTTGLPKDFFDPRKFPPRGKTRLDKLLDLFKHEDAPTTRTQAGMDTENQDKKQRTTTGGAKEDPPGTNKFNIPIPTK